MGRFINADAFAATGQGLLGNNMFAYCNNNPVNYTDFNGQDPFAATASIVAAAAILVVGATVIARCTVNTLWIIASRITDSIQTAWAKISYAKEAAEPDPPDVTYPGDDEKKAPEGYEWKGKGEQGSKDGSYYNKETGESLHPDLNHPEGKDPHWDYNYRGSGVKGWRVFRDNRIELKK